MIVHVCQGHLVAAPLNCWAAVPVCLSVCFNLWLYKPRFDKRESKLKYLCLFSIFLSFMGKKCFRYMEYMVKVDLLWISTSVWSSVIHILGHQHTFLGVPSSALWQLMEGGGEEKGTNWWSGASKQRVIACIFLFLLTQKLEEVNYPFDSNGIYNLLSKFNYSLNWVTAVVSWLLPLLWRVLCTAFVMDGRQAVLDVSPSEWRLQTTEPFLFNSAVSHWLTLMPYPLNPQHKTMQVPLCQPPSWWRSWDQRAWAVRPVIEAHMVGLQSRNEAWTWEGTWKLT